MEIQRSEVSSTSTSPSQFSISKASEACLSLFSSNSIDELQQLFNSSLCYELQQYSYDSIIKKLQTSKLLTQAARIESNEGLTLDLVLIFTLSTEIPSCLNVGIFDITELSDSKSELEETLLRYELIVEGAYGGIWDWNVAQQTVHYSENWCKLRNGTKADFSNHQDEWLNSIHPDDQGRVINAVQEHMDGITPYFEQEYRIICKDNSIKWISDRGIATRDADGKVIRMAGSEFDITEHRKVSVQSQLAASVFESIGEAVLILGLDGSIVDANNAFLSLFGFRAADIMNKPFCDMFSFQQRGFISNIIENRHSTSVNEINISTATNEQILCKLKLNSARNKEGEVTHLICLISDIRAIKSNEQLLHKLAYKDLLTQLPNRLSLVEFLNNAVKVQTPFTLFFLDIDNFKYINDGLGHAAGDELLKHVAKTITSSVRREDLVARLGGDEFVIVMSNLSNRADIEKTARHLLSNINNRVVLQQKEVVISASIGISTWPDDGADVDSLLQNADAAMYQAKAQGKQSYQFYTECMTQKAVERVDLEADIDRAIINNEFVLHYQPQFCVEQRVVKGIEALIRWQPKGQDIIYPDKFITLAEESGSIISIGNWVLVEACKQAKIWLDDNINFGVISVNISAKQLMSEELLTSIKVALEQSELPPEYLELEVTESFILHQPIFVTSLLEKIAALGISLAVDDFGTGYSSLSYLKKLPFHRLKIDRSFIKDIPIDENDVAITEAIIVLSNKLGLEVIAEGTENLEQIEFLLERGCQMAQGYYFSRPLPEQEITEYLLAHTG